RPVAAPWMHAVDDEHSRPEERVLDDRRDDPVHDAPAAQLHEDVAEAGAVGGVQREPDRAPAEQVDVGVRRPERTPSKRLRGRPDRRSGNARERATASRIHARYASFSRTSCETIEPSARPDTCGITSAITRPRSPMLVAPTSAITLSTIASSSSSDSGSGMNS